MGKTSLMIRILEYARHHGHRPVSFSFEKLRAEVSTTPETFLQHVCASLTDELVVRAIDLVGFQPAEVVPLEDGLRVVTGPLAVVNVSWLLRGQALVNL